MWWAFIIMACTFIIKWCTFSNVWSAFGIMCLYIMCFKTFIMWHGFFLKRCTFLFSTSCSNIFMFCTNFVMWCANFVMMMNKVTWQFLTSKVCGRRSSGKIQNWHLSPNLYRNFTDANVNELTMQNSYWHRLFSFYESGSHLPRTWNHLLRHYLI